MYWSTATTLPSLPTARLARPAWPTYAPHVQARDFCQRWRCSFYWCSCSFRPAVCFFSLRRPGPRESKERRGPHHAHSGGKGRDERRTGDRPRASCTCGTHSRTPRRPSPHPPPPPPPPTPLSSSVPPPSPASGKRKKKATTTTTTKITYAMTVQKGRLLVSWLVG